MPINLICCHLNDGVSFNLTNVVACQNLSHDYIDKRKNERQDPIPHLFLSCVTQLKSQRNCSPPRVTIKCVFWNKRVKARCYMNRCIATMLTLNFHEPSEHRVCEMNFKTIFITKLLNNWCHTNYILRILYTFFLYPNKANGQSNYENGAEFLFTWASGLSLKFN